ncbi:MAG TPA: TIGR03435 family protein [Bryobacteraceae bacterium]|nr:TIGR03435 family protein [Bryobacteraceae bacterium]
MKRLSFVRPFAHVLSAAGFVLAFLCAPHLRAQPQTASAPPAFEVASVRVAVGPNGVRGGCHGIDSHYSPRESTAAPPLGRCVITDGRLSHLIGVAYGVPMNRIKDAPDWVIAGSERFTVQAKAEDPATATEQQLLGMLQTLLFDRFKLRFHRENKDLPGFALVVGKKRPKLTEAQGDEVTTSFGAAFKPLPGQPVSLTARKYSMPLLAGLLSQIGPGPIVDQTNLAGDYDFNLAWDESTGPSLVTALQEQLGLRLEPQKVPVSFFMFESAQRPAEN